MLLLDRTEPFDTNRSPLLDDTPRRVLVVGCADAGRSEIARALTTAGYSITESTTGEQALALTRSRDFDALIIDVDLPDVAGLELGRQVRQSAPASLPIVHLSAGLLPPHERVEGLRAGPVAYLVHPLDLDELVATLDALVQCRRAELDHQRAAAAYAARERDEALFRALTEQSREFVAILEPDGAFRYVSPSVRTSLGYTSAELIGRYPMELVHDDDRPTMLATYQTLSEGPLGTTADMMVRLRHRDGSWRYLEGGGENMLHHPAVHGISANFRDVTARVEERRSMAAVFQDAPSFIAVVAGPNHIFERVNAAFERVVGRSDVAGRAITTVLAPEQAESFARILDQVRATGETVSRFAVPVHLPPSSGEPAETRYLNIIYQKLSNHEDRVVVHGLDITNQIETVEALRTTEARLRQQFAKLPVPTFLLEAAGDDFVLIDFNDAAEWHLKDGRAAIGRSITGLFRAYDDLLNDARLSLHDGVVVHHTVDVGGDARGRGQSYEITIGPQPPDRLLLHAVDVSERRRLAEELRQAHKMEAVGQLAGGVAHDFNNLLTVIGAHTSFLVDGLQPDDPKRTDVAAIQRAADSAAALTRQLLAFSRKQLLNPAVVDLNIVVEDVHRMLGRIVGEDIEVVRNVSSELGRVLVDRGQVEQVLMNLILNARDAMPGGGRLTIATANREITADSGLPDFVRPGAYALLSVADTGVGMNADTKLRVFEPFFTTKEPGRGTGLGLSTVYGIVKQSDGYVLVTSTLEAGTTFDVYFPLVEGTVAQSAETEAQGRSGGGQTILVVEDDPAVRQIATRILAREGYNVLEAKDGATALAISAARREPIDAVLSDAVMPGLSGVEVLRAVREQHPECRTMLMSGYADDEMTRRGIRASDVAFLPKPFAPAELARSIRQLLETVV